MGEIPEDEGQLMQSVLNDPEAKYNSADLNVAYKMGVDEYQKLCPFAEALEENWGKPPGQQQPPAMPSWITGTLGSFLGCPCPCDLALSNTLLQCPAGLQGHSCVS